MQTAARPDDSAERDRWMPTWRRCGPSVSTLHSWEYTSEETVEVRCLRNFEQVLIGQVDSGPQPDLRDDR